MNLLVAHAIFTVCCLPVALHASDVVSTTPGGQFRRDETGIVAHGTIFKIRDDRIVIIPSTSLKPVHFMHGEGTVYVDEHGDPLVLNKVKPGVSVTVFYSQSADHPIANRVVVSGTRPPESSQRLAKEPSQ